MNTKALDNLDRDFPWSRQALTLICLLSADEEHVRDGSSPVHAYLYLPTSEENVIRNIRFPGVTMDDLREWQQAAADFLEVEERSPVYRTLTARVTHSRPHCQFADRGPDRAIVILDRSVFSTMREPVDRFLATMARQLDVPIHTNADLLYAACLARTPATTLRGYAGLRRVGPISPDDLVPDVVALIRQQFAGSEIELERFNLPPSEEFLERLVARGADRMVAVHAHSFNASSCCTETGFILPEMAWSNFVRQFQLDKVVQQLDRSAEKARTQVTALTEAAHLLDLLGDHLSQNQPMPAERELELWPAGKRFLMQAGLVRVLSTGRVILAGSVGAPDSISRLKFDLARQAQRAVRLWLESPVRWVPPNAKPDGEPENRPSDDGIDPSSVPIILGASDPDVEWGNIGFTNSRPVALNLTVGRRSATGPEMAQTISVFGTQGSGKSYSVGVILEMALRPLKEITTLQKPLAGIVFHYSQKERYTPEYLGMRHPNPDPTAQQQLRDLFQLGDRHAVEDIVVLVPKSKLADRQRELSGVEVQPLLFNPSELSLADWQILMGAPGSENLYMEQIKSLLQTLHSQGRVSLESIRDAVQGSRMTVQQKRLVSVRLELASRYLSSGASLRSYVRPGRLTVLDIRDPMIDATEAMRLCLISLRQFQNVEHEGENIPKLVVLDEAHKYIGSAFAEEIVTVVREMRHTATSVAIASQEPLSIPATVIGLSSIVFLHRVTAPDWLKHLQRGCAGLSELTAKEVAELRPGEAFVWARESSSAEKTGQPIRVRIRPRFTQH